MSLKPHVDLSVAAAQRLLDGVMDGAQATHVARIHGGEIASIYEISLGADRPPVILKVYPETLRWKLRKEASMLRLVADRLRVPAPHVLAVDDTRTRLDLDYMLMTKLDGVVFGPLDATLPRAQYLEGYRQIGQLLRDLHAIPMAAFGYIGADGIMTPHVTNRAYITTQFARKLAEFERRGGDAGLARAVTAFAADGAHLLDACAEPVLCHNDLHAGNVLARVDAAGAPRLTGVVDFENTQAADPLMDIAKAAYYLKSGERDALLSGYGDNGRPDVAETLAYYHVYFVLVLWCWMAEIGNAAALPGITRDLELGLRSPA
jgi:aminoglycoside phosphotransferase (APT) family kinase protein